MPWAQFDEEGNYHETAYPKVRCSVHRAVLCGGIGAAAMGTVWLEDFGIDGRNYREGAPFYVDAPDRCNDDRDDFGHTCETWRDLIDNIGNNK